MTHYLVTGGAGFVGGQVVLALLDAGAEVTVLDSLVTGFRAAVPAAARLVVGDVGDAALLDGLLAERRWAGVLHFAALSQVGESMAQPLRYLRANAGGGLTLIEACARHGIGRFVLSSTAALFGAAGAAIGEDAPIAPLSPYGESKWMLERALAWPGQAGAGRAHGMRSACLRYFNAAGADPDGRAGEAHDPETHLIPLAIDAALGRRPALRVFGDDYPTPDGTCVRDYVHVADLAEAHLLALRRLETGSVTYNLGGGTGASVREVLRAVQRVTGRAVPHEVVGRRAGDAAVLVASNARICAETGWAPRRSALETVVADAVAWRVAHPMGYGS